MVRSRIILLLLSIPFIFLIAASLLVYSQLHQTVGKDIVFDIPSGDGTTIIPIRNPLVVTDPKAFVITLEQPGGVVVSKQEVVVALAKPS